MARESKAKGKDAHANEAKAPKRASNGQRPKLDAKLSRLVARRLKKLHDQLREATRQERKRVQALDKAHRRRQLIEAAIDELSMDVPVGQKQAAEVSTTASESVVPVTVAAPVEAPVPTTRPAGTSAATRRAVAKPAARTARTVDAAAKPAAAPRRKASPQV